MQDGTAKVQAPCFCAQHLSVIPACLECRCFSQCRRDGGSNHLKSLYKPPSFAPWYHQTHSSSQFVSRNLHNILALLHILALPHILNDILPSTSISPRHSYRCSLGTFAAASISLTSLIDSSSQRTQLLSRVVAVSVRPSASAPPPSPCDSVGPFEANVSVSLSPVSRSPPLFVSGARTDCSE